MHREQNFLSRSWKAYLSLIEESPRLAGITCQEQTNGSQAARWRLFQDGAQVYGIVRNTTGEGAEWQLYAIDVKTGAEKMLAPLDLPASTDGVDGQRFLIPGAAATGNAPSLTIVAALAGGVEEVEQKAHRTTDTAPRKHPV
jgi:hypothetical protein